MKISRQMFILSAFALTLMLITPGCTSLTSGYAKSAVAKSVENTAKAYYTQPRTAQLISLKGVNSLNLQGDDITLEVSGTLPPLSIMPKDPSTSGRIVDAAESVARIGIAAFAGERIISHLSQRPTVVDPKIVEQPRPLVVETRR